VRHLLKEQPAAYYRATADRYRQLPAEAATPSLIQQFGEMIARCERLAKEIEASETEASESNAPLNSQTADTAPD
jgi:hypothetical protein